jgi:hypothetical protein
MATCKQVLVCVLLFSSSATGAVTAQQSDQDRSPMPPVIEWPQEQTTGASGINYAVVFGEPEPPAAASPTQELALAFGELRSSAQLPTPQHQANPRAY